MQRTTRSVIRGRAPTVAPRDIAALAEACRDGRAVRFGYRRARRRALATAGRAQRPRHRAQRVVPDRLRPRPRRLAAVPRRPHAGRRGHRARHDAARVAGRRRDGRSSPRRSPTCRTRSTPRSTSSRPADAVLAALGWLNPRRVEALGRRRCRLRLGAASVEDLVEELLDVVRLGAVDDDRCPARGPLSASPRSPRPPPPPSRDDDELADVTVGPERGERAFDVVEAECSAWTIGATAPLAMASASAVHAAWTTATRSAAVRVRNVTPTRAMRLRASSSRSIESWRPPSRPTWTMRPPIAAAAMLGATVVAPTLSTITSTPRPPVTRRPPRPARPARRR